MHFSFFVAVVYIHTFQDLLHDSLHVNLTETSLEPLNTVAEIYPQPRTTMLIVGVAASC